MPLRLSVYAITVNGPVQSRTVAQAMVECLRWDAGQRKVVDDELRLVGGEHHVFDAVAEGSVVVSEPLEQLIESVTRFQQTQSTSHLFDKGGYATIV